jgi:hypothetical protein
MSCDASYRDTVTLLYALVEQKLCYGFHKCSTAELTLSTLNPAQTLTLAPIQILCILLPRRVEFDPKLVMCDLKWTESHYVRVLSENLNFSLI